MVQGKTKSPLFIRIIKTKLSVVVVEIAEKTSCIRNKHFEKYTFFTANHFLCGLNTGSAIWCPGSPPVPDRPLPTYDLPDSRRHRPASRECAGL